MASPEEPLLSLLTRTLSLPALTPHLTALSTGDFASLLSHPTIRLLLGHDVNDARTADVPPLADHPDWSAWLARRLAAVLADAGEEETAMCFLAALAALNAFVQSNVTGPPLPFASAALMFPEEDVKRVREVRKALVRSLGADGVGAYALVPNVELLCFAQTVVAGCEGRAGLPGAAVAWARVRCGVMRQRLFGGEVAASVQEEVYGAVEEVKGLEDEEEVAWLLERAAVHTLHGFEKRARGDLDEAGRRRGFVFALTGKMGRRTKWQEKETSQLVVLARSRGTEVEGEGKGKGTEVVKDEEDEVKPKTLDLNDDTLLESISFSEKAKSSTDVLDENSLPPALAALDPGNQPKLEPLDSIILLSLASSITNTSPQNGLTREETVPYATRVIEGGSSNWQVYTQALLVRSRIEGYKSRTMERGLLQLQALVDQVIADTAGEGTTTADSKEASAPTFLPRPQEEDSAPVSERLRYVFQLATPTRWELESELAQTWVKMGGLRTALEIYERLELWAEVALCWAATEKEDKAKTIIRRQLFHATDANDEAAGEDEKWEGAPRDPPPADAPRLYCIMADIDNDPALYEKAWEVSGHRYARAQRSLARLYYANKDFVKAVDAYSASLRNNQLNGQSWFAMGCALLELAEYHRAVEAFTRVVQLDDHDAEAWSNLAAALLYLDPQSTTDSDTQSALPAPKLDDEEDDDNIAPTNPTRDPQQHRRDALKALKRAAHLQHDNHRIWSNLLTVAASLSPPSHTDLITAQRHIIDLRGKTDGEACVDAPVLAALVRHIIAIEEDGYDPSKPGPTRMLVKLVDEAVVPLITSSRLLWATVARLALWRKKPERALEANEKAWRAVVSQPGWEGAADEKRWEEVVDATVELADAYESLGPMERTEGMAAGSGEVVAKDWRFKARSAVRGVCSRGKETWEGTEGWERLRTCLEGLKA